MNTSFFTRVGLRYINVSPLRLDVQSYWIREDFLPGFGVGSKNKLGASWVQSTGQWGGSQLNLQYKVVPVQSGELRNVVDVDVSRLQIEIKKTIETVDQMNRDAYSAFTQTPSELGRKDLEERTKET